MGRRGQDCRVRQSSTRRVGHARGRAAAAVHLWAPTMAGDERLIAGWPSTPASRAARRDRAALPLPSSPTTWSTSFPPSGCRRSCCIARATFSYRSATAAGSPSTSPTHASSSSRARPSALRRRRRWRAGRDRGVPGRVPDDVRCRTSPRDAPRHRCRPPVHRHRRRRLARGHRRLWPDRLRSPHPVRRPPGQAHRIRHARRLRRAGTGHPVRWESSTPPDNAASMRTSESTPVSARWTTRRSTASPSTSPPRSPRRRPRGRSWCPARCATSWPARGSASATRGPSRSRVSPAAATCSPFYAMAPARTTRRLAIEQAEVLRRDGEYWTVAYDGHVAALRDTKGVRDLARLLAAPHHEFHVLDLGAEAGDTRPIATRKATDADLHREHSSAEPIIDDRARVAYKRRIDELQAAIDDADRRGDPRCPPGPAPSSTPSSTSSPPRTASAADPAELPTASNAPPRRSPAGSATPSVASNGHTHAAATSRPPSEPGCSAPMHPSGTSTGRSTTTGEHRRCRPRRGGQWLE